MQCYSSESHRNKGKKENIKLQMPNENKETRSNPLVVFALDLMSTYEGEHTVFGLLGQANLIQNDVLQFHPFTSK
jgi:hypothetical protein